MEGKKRRFPWRAARWERMLLTAVATVLSGEVFFNLGNDNFRISGAVVLFPVLLLTLLQDSRTPLTGVLTGACLLLVRSAIDIVGGGEVWTRAILLNCPAAIFYPCYDGLLCLLVRRRGTVLTRDEILAAVWNYDFTGETRTVDMHIKALRQKLGEGYITTVRSVGYKMG